MPKGNLPWGGVIGEVEGSVVGGDVGEGRGDKVGDAERRRRGVGDRV